MIRRVVLHIGSPKTGTSALQVLLARRRAELAAAGCHYPTNTDVVHAAAGGITSGNALGMAKSLRTDLPHRLSGEDWLAEFCSMLAGLPAEFDQVLYSSEFLWRARHDRLQRLHDIVVDAGFGLRIIAYIRPQDEFAVSQYSQLVKRHHETRSLEEVVRGIEIDFLPMLDNYAAVVGREAMTVRVFDADQFVGGSLATDFLTQLDLPLTGFVGDDERVARRVNPSVSLQQSEAMRFLNRVRLPVMIMDEVPGAYERLGAVMPASEPLALSEEASEHLRGRFREENATIEARYLVEQEVRFKTPVAGARRSPPPARWSSVAAGGVAASMAFRRLLRQARARLAGASTPRRPGRRRPDEHG